MSEGKAHELNEVGSESFSSEVGYQYSSPHKLVSSSKKRLTSAILIVFAIVIVVLLFPSKTQAQKQTRKEDPHEDLTFAYPTIGIPHPGNKYNSTRVKDEDLATFDETLLALLKPFNDTDCQFERYGDMDPNFGGEGGYVICKNWIKDSQGIVNIGINGFDAFGCQVSAEGNFINEQYDCYNLTETPCADNGYQNHMHNSCLGEKTEEDHEGRKYQTYQNILRETHLENKRIILKIDCEGCEFPGLKYIPVEMFDKVDMIVGEWHLRTGYMEEWGILDIVRTLTEKFVVVNLHMTNFACSFSPLRKVKALAMEYTMVNKKLITKRSESQSYALHPLNKPSVNQNKDCQII